MNQAYRALQDGLPARADPRTLSFPSEPKRLRLWIDALPRANPGLIQRQLSEALTALAGVRLSGPARLGVLEQLRPVTLETMAGLSRQLQGSTLPLPPAKARLLDQLVDFERVLAFNYRLATIELCNGGKLPFLRGAAAAKVIERTLWHRSRELLLAYGRYLAPAEGVWRELHALMGFARAHRLGDKAVDEPAAGQPVTIRQLYQQTVLLALSNPYRFNQREQAELWAVALVFAEQLPLHDRRPASDDAVAIPQDGDAGPGFIPEERGDEQGGLLWLDLAPLRRLLEDPLAETRSGPVQLRVGRHTVEATAELLRRLRAGWGSAAAARSHHRLSAGHVLETVFGLSGAHHQLAGGLDFDAFLHHAGVSSTTLAQGRHDWANTGADAGRVPTFDAEVLDQSLGGYRVSWPAEQQVKAKVGELVGLSLREDGDRRWMLGTIRWLRYAADGRVDAGIELLARRARAVAVRSLDPGSHRPRLRAIEFEPLRDAEPDGLRLVAPSVLEALGGDLEIIRMSGEFDGDFGEAPKQETCRNAQVLENAGDHLLVAAERQRATAAA